MAALTILLLAMSSAGVLSRSAQAVARLRDAHADAVLAPRLLVAAFALPMVLGRARVALDGVIDDGLSSALVTVAFASRGDVVPVAGSDPDAEPASTAPAPARGSRIPGRRAHT